MFVLSISGMASQAENTAPAKHNYNALHPKFALKKIIIPEVDYERLTLPEALETLTVQIKHASDQKITPNFIIHDLNGEFEKRRITLALTNVPADVLLQYITDQVRGAIHYNRHATIIRPLRPPSR